MDIQALAEVVGFDESREVERIVRDGQAMWLVPGKTTSRITLTARGETLTFEVPEKVVYFLTGP